MADVSPLVLSAGLVLFAYLLGSIPFGLVLARRKGVDITSVGSKNIGATNVARNLGKKLGLLVLVLDALKGGGPVWLATFLVNRGVVDPFAVTGAGLAAVLGHCFPVWLTFVGGKGVATALGIMLVMAPAQAGLAVLLFAGLYAAFRVASIGSLAASAAFAPALWLFDYPATHIALAVGLAAVIWFQHRGNIARLIRGKENKV